LYHNPFRKISPGPEFGTTVKRNRAVVFAPILAVITTGRFQVFAEMGLNSGEPRSFNADDPE